jgi:hypothetical protein
MCEEGKIGAKFAHFLLTFKKAGATLTTYADISIGLGIG